MNKALKHIIVILGLLLIAGSSPGLFAQGETAVNLIFRKDSVDVCGTESAKEVIVSVDMGDVYYQDGFYGYDLGIKYDREKIKFISALKVNTISEQCLDNFFFRTDTLKDGSGLIDIQGLTGDMQSPIGGDRPLVAIQCQYIGECPDETTMDIAYFDPVDGYKKEITELNGVKIKAVIKDKKDRYLNTFTDRDSVDKFNADGFAKLLVTADYSDYALSKLKNIDYRIEISSGTNFTITDIKPADEEITLNSIEPVTNGFVVNTEFSADIKDKNLFEIEIKKKENISDEGILTVTPVQINDCACITKLNDTKVYLKSVKDSTTNVIEESKEISSIQAYYSTQSEEFIIKSDMNIKDIKIYNLQGYAVPAFINGIGGKLVKASTVYLSNGNYFLVIRNSDTEINKIMLIKY